MDDTSLFSAVTDAALSNSHLNDNLSQINDWTHNWKMSFNPDSTKPAHEAVFIRKENDVHYNAPVQRTQSYKHLGLTLSLKLDFLNFV